mmetsp:Transcript_24195/g.52175  ORF Transcript_24195/g.52175 Transcript_24195/m.52175 type:complete len:118 (+) Transcript_24195:54-407(+)
MFHCITLFAQGEECKKTKLELLRSALHQFCQLYTNTFGSLHQIFSIKASPPYPPPPSIVSIALNTIISIKSEVHPIIIQLYQYHLNPLNNAFLDVVPKQYSYKQNQSCMESLTIRNL